MTEAGRDLLECLGIALALGLLVGLQRERTGHLLAGLRTFAVITVLGTLAAAVDVERGADGWVVAAGFLAVAGTTLGARFAGKNKTAGEGGMTTEIAVLLMYAVGAYLAEGDRLVAVAVGVGAAVLLQFKPELHGAAQRLGEADLRAIMTFCLISFVVLPILPNRTYDAPPPLDVLNPFEAWLMVVLIVGISLGGYLAYKFFGKRRGVLLGGFLGGAISSTATTASWSRRARAEGNGQAVAATVILIATSVVYIRVLLEIAVAGRQLFADLAPPIAVVFAVAAASSLIAWRGATGSGTDPLEPKNPTEIKSAIVFGALYAGVLMALSVAKSQFGDQGLYSIAVLSGLTDMDAITLSSVRMARDGADAGGIALDDAWRLIIAALVSNLVFKARLSAMLGGPRLGLRLALLFTPQALAAAAVLACWP